MTCYQKSKLQIGDNCIFKSKTNFNFQGLNKKMSIHVSKNAELIIENNCGLLGSSIFCSKNIQIGGFCNFSSNTFIWDTDFHPLDYGNRRIHYVSEIISKPIKIGDDVFIGANSIILKVVTIGSKSIIGAGSVVTKSIPADEIWAGNPSKYIRKIN